MTDPLQHLARHDVLTPHAEKKLARAAREGDLQARERLIRSNIRLVLKVAAPFRYRTFGLDFDDIVQAGIVGLHRAVDKFDPERGFKLSTYATWWIRQAIQREIGNFGRTIRMPIHIDGRRHRVRIFLEANPDATDDEIAEHLGIDVHHLHAALNVAEVSTSLDKDVGGGDGDGGVDWFELLADPNSPDPEMSVVRSAECEPIRQAVMALPELERRVIELRFGFNGPVRGIKEIAELLGLPTNVISNLQRRALEHLRETAPDWYSKNEE